MTIRTTRPAIAVALAIAFQPALAASGDDEAAIVITASRFPELRDQLPVGTQIITAREIAASGAQSLPEALARLGTLMVRNNAGDSNPQIDLRGFGITGDQNTLVLLDGIRISENEQAVARLSAIPLDAIERIEILAGAGAVLYGAGATAGTINIITRGTRPGETSGLAGIGIGSYGNQSVRARLATANEHFGFSINASGQQSDNYRRNNALDEQNVDGELRLFRNAGDLFVKFGGSRQRLGMPGPVSMAQLAIDPRAASTPLDHGFTDTARIMLGGRSDLGFGELAAELAWRGRDTEGWFAAGGGTSHTGVDMLSLTPRLKLPYRLADRDGTLVLGMDLSSSSLRRVINQPNWWWWSDLETQQNDRAFYFHNSTQLAATTRLTLGGRWQHTDYEQTERIAPATHASKSIGLRAWELGLRQGLSGGFDIYGRLGTSFRVANIDDNGFTLSGQLLEPQTSKDTEIGMEWRQRTNRLRLAWFESRIDNEIHYMNVPGLFFFNGGNTNLPPTRHRGLELDGSWAATGDLTLRGGYRLTEARFQSGVFSGVDVAGHDIPLVPRHRITLGVEYRIDSSWSAAAAAQYIGNQYYDNDQANSFQKMPAYTLIDLKFSWRRDGWKVSGGIDNLTDKRYYSYAIRNNAGTSFNAYPEAGRRLTFAAEYAFR